MAHPAMKIRIVRTPPGEAPEHIRSAWVGLVLPLVVAGPQDNFAAGVLSGPRTRIGWLVALTLGRARKERGYTVDSRRAIELLAAHAPEAAQWWRERTPQLLQPGRWLQFAAEACEEVQSDG